MEGDTWKWIVSGAVSLALCFYIFLYKQNKK